MLRITTLSIETLIMTTFYIKTLIMTTLTVKTFRMMLNMTLSTTLTLYSVIFYRVPSVVMLNAALLRVVPLCVAFVSVVMSCVNRLRVVAPRCAQECLEQQPPRRIQCRFQWLWYIWPGSTCSNALISTSPKPHRLKAFKIIYENTSKSKQKICKKTNVNKN
jgi:hypothetical protein